jgi:hypothetical protein
MVKDNRFTMSRSKRIRRRSSWKDLFRDFASGSDRDPDPSSGSQVRRSLSVPHNSNNHSMGDEETPDDDVGAFADRENNEDEDEDDDLGHRKEEDWPISARVRYANPPAVSSPVSRSGSMLAHEQQLSAAPEEVSDGATETTESEGSPKEKAPIGTRLTMTSRTGYFQDRIVAPSMVRLSSSAVASR